MYWVKKNIVTNALAHTLVQTKPFSVSKQNCSEDIDVDFSDSSRLFQQIGPETMNTILNVSSLRNTEVSLCCRLLCLDTGWFLVWGVFYCFVYSISFIMIAPLAHCPSHRPCKMTESVDLYSDFVVLLPLWLSMISGCTKCRHCVHVIWPFTSSVHFESYQEGPKNPRWTT